MSDRVDLLGDDLVHVQRVEPPSDTTVHDAMASQTPRPGDITGLCSLCHAKQAAEKCLHCEHLVCREHFWIMLGLCKSCATDEELQRAREGADRPRPDLDIKWVED